MKVKIIIGGTQREIARAVRQVPGVIPFNPTILMPGLHRELPPLLLVKALEEAIAQLESAGLHDVEFIVASQLKEQTLQLYRHALMQSGLPATTLRLPPQYPWTLIPYEVIIDAVGPGFVEAIRRTKLDYMTEDWWPFPGDPL